MLFRSELEAAAATARQMVQEMLAQQQQAAAQLARARLNAQLEREQLKQRQREGIDAAKNKGKHLGRPSTSLPDNWEEVLALWQSGKITAREAMRRTGMKRTMFYQLAHK